MHRNRADQQHNKKNRQSVNWEQKRLGFGTKQGKAVSEVRQKVRSSQNLGLQKQQKTKNFLTGLRNDAAWVDWVKDYVKKAKNLDKLDSDGRNVEILKYADKIHGSFNEDRRTHNLNIRLKLPIIDYTLKYESKDKKPGYESDDGSNIAAIDIQSHTKKLGKR